MYLHYHDALRLKKPAIFQVMIKPSGPSCNLNCTYCYYLEKKKLYSGSNFRMSEETLEHFIKTYIDSVEMPVVSFIWQGGEPTLMGIDFFRKAVDLQKKYAGNKKIENSFQTNGTLLNDEWCRFLSENKMLVGISIDGEEHNHNHFRKTANGKPSFTDVMNSIELLHKHRVEFNTLSTVNSYNAQYALETYHFLKKIGSGFIQFLPVVERAAKNSDTAIKLVNQEYKDEATVTEWSVKSDSYGRFLSTIFDEWVRNDVARYYVQIFDATLANWCVAMPGLCVFSETCGEALIMEHNGDIYSCDHYVYPEYSLGNVSEKSLTEMFKSPHQFEFGLNKRNTLPEYCLGCEVLFACHGECPKHRFINTPDGKPNLNYLCSAYRMFFNHVKPYMDFMAKELNDKRSPSNIMRWIRNKENQGYLSRNVV